MATDSATTYGLHGDPFDRMIIATALHARDAGVAVLEL
jgi:PIN domain nuclease of toxin-antitoxin system